MKFLLFFLLLPLNVQAARWAVVDADEAALLDSPSFRSKVLQTINKGTKIQISNYPVESYYKARLPGGKIGWILSDAIVVQMKPDQIGSSYVKDLIRKEEKEEEVKEKKGKEKAELKKVENQTYVEERNEQLHDVFDDEDQSRKKFSLQVSSGLSIPAQIGAGTLFGETSLGNLNYTSAEFRFQFTQAFAFVGWAGVMSTRFVGVSSSSLNESFDMNLSAVPVLGGVDWTFFRFFEDKLRVRISALGGLSFENGVVANRLGSTSAKISGTGTSLVGLGKLVMDYQFSRRFFISAEGGYTLFLNPAVELTEAGSWGSVLQSSESSVFMNPSGFMAGVSLGVSF